MRQSIRSFALGLLTATALLAFTYFNIDSDKEKIDSTESAKEQLAAEGYHVLSEDEYKELKEKQETTETSTNVNEEEKSEEETSSEEKDEVSTYTLTIEPGMYSSTISEKLFEAGIIDSETDFSNFLEDEGYSTLIQIGEYELHSDMTQQEIAETITR